MKYLRESQSESLGKIEDMAVFKVINDDFNDLVLVDIKQNVIASYKNNFEGYEQMYCKINIIKLSRYLP